MKVTVDQEEDPVLGRGSQWFGKWIGGEGKQMHVQTALSEGSAVSTQTSFPHVRPGPAGPAREPEYIEAACEWTKTLRSQYFQVRSLAFYSYFIIRMRSVGLVTF